MSRTRHRTREVIEDYNDTYSHVEGFTPLKFTGKTAPAPDGEGRKSKDGK